MDYSLLVGVDETNGELILGIVDYMRTYTLDKVMLFNVVSRQQSASSLGIEELVEDLILKRDALTARPPNQNSHSVANAFVRNQEIK